MAFPHRSLRRARPGRAAVLAAALAASGAQQASGGNLVDNGDFAGAIDGWQLHGTCQVFYDDVVGSPLPGSLGMNCLGAGAPVEIAVQCVTMKAEPVDFSARWTRNTSLPPASGATAWYEPFDDEHCTGTSLGLFAAAPHADVAGTSCCGETWHELASRNAALPAGTGSVAVILATGSGDVLVFDHVFLRPASVFTDGFDR